jgi:hypothetical protein
MAKKKSNPGKNKSADDGQFKSADFAKKNPKTTYKLGTKKKPKK